MKIYNCEQKTDEWLKLRLGKFTSTDAQAVATNGKGLETLVYQKVGEILSGKVEKNDYINPDMERGNEKEASARTAYEIETGNQVTQVGFIEYDEYTGGSPDGLVSDDGMIEIKCHNQANFVKLKYTKKIDTKYLWQIKHLLLITGRKWCDYVAFNDNFSDLVIVGVTLDDESKNKLLTGLDEGKKQIKKIIESLK
jgi:putative phage-type endonuclease